MKSMLRLLLLVAFVAAVAILAQPVHAEGQPTQHAQQLEERSGAEMVQPTCSSDPAVGHGDEQSIALCDRERWRCNLIPLCTRTESTVNIACSKLGRRMCDSQPARSDAHSCFRLPVPPLSSVSSLESSPLDFDALLGASGVFLEQSADVDSYSEVDADAEAAAEDSAEALEDAEAEVDSEEAAAADADADAMRDSFLEVSDDDRPTKLTPRVHIHVSTKFHGGEGSENLLRVEQKFDSLHQRVMQRLNKLMGRVERYEEDLD
jgi:hypothetical protein